MEHSTVFVHVVIVISMALVSGSLDSTVRTTHGDVIGRVTSVLDQQVAVYWGIPYGKIPARFQRPERADAWEGVLEATSPPPSCPEIPYSLNIPMIPPPSTAMEENCLYLNLWVPRGCAAKADEDGLAIMVWIHGGALQFGSSTVPTYNGQVLAATQCVIVASMNYRLGVLGFLSTGTASAPGNVGLLDQVLALQWIHDNARNFGGSPDRITLFGESAGGMSVAMHMASPLSKHLFSQAIIQSAPLLPSRWGGDTVSRNVASTRKLAEIMECSVDDDAAMLRCLSEADSMEMGKVVSDSKRFGMPAFGIVIDNHFLETSPLSEPDHATTNTKKIKVMIGTTRDDGNTALPLYTGEPISQSHKPQIDQSTFYTILENRIFRLLQNQPRSKRLLAKILEYIYINSSLPERRDDYHTALGNIAGDLVFFCPQYKLKASVLPTNDVYMYSFEHRSSVSQFPEWMGVVHASEIDFVFGRPLDQGDLFTEEEKQLSKLMMKAWANFAKFGNPNSADVPTQWPSLNNATYPYAVFQSPSDVTIQHGFRYRQCVFWNEAYSALVTKPATTSDAAHSHDEL